MSLLDIYVLQSGFWSLFPRNPALTKFKHQTAATEGYVWCACEREMPESLIVFNFLLTHYKNVWTRAVIQHCNAQLIGTAVIIQLRYLYGHDSIGNGLYQFSLTVGISLVSPLLWHLLISVQCFGRRLQRNELSNISLIISELRVYPKVNIFGLLLILSFISGQQSPLVV